MSPFDIPPEQRELIMYGAFCIWIAANLVVYFFTRDEFEFYNHKTGDPLPWYRVSFYACLGTIPAMVRVWWSERNE